MKISEQLIVNTLMIAIILSLLLLTGCVVVDFEGKPMEPMWYETVCEEEREHYD